MGTIAGVGRSLAACPVTAGTEAATQACSALGGAPDFCLVFATSGYDQQRLIDGIRSVAPGARLSGCTGEGVIAGPESDECDRAVSLLAVRSDQLAFDTFLARGYSADPVRCGRELAASVAAAMSDDAIGLLVFPDGLHGNCTALLRAIEAGLPRPLPVVGGAAGDAMLFERTWQYCDGEATHDAVAAVLLRGRGELELHVSHGCQAIGMRRVVTDAEGGWLRRIDDRPAWSVFREFLDGNPEDLNAEGMAHLSLAEQLAVGPQGGYGEIIIRTPLELNRDSGALFFPGGGIPSGTVVWMARRDPIRIRESARACAERVAAPRAPRRPEFVLQFDCAGRGRIMFGPRVAEEIVRPLQQVLGDDLPWIGFHTYGEIAPVAGRAYYHNYTVALCAVYARE